MKSEGLKKCYGFEPNLKTVTKKNFDKIRIINCKKELMELGPFDIIRLNHVIEHLVHIDETMVFLKNNLSQNGCVILQTPNPQSMTFRLFKRYWGPLHYPYHTVLFTKKGLSIASTRWKFKDIDAKSATLMPTGWSMSFENYLKKLFKIKKTGRLKIYAFLSILCLPLTLFERTLKRGNSAIMDYILYKQQKM